MEREVGGVWCRRGWRGDVGEGGEGGRGGWRER